jgi:hypothetical protein
MDRRETGASLRALELRSRRVLESIVDPAMLPLAQVEAEL